MALALAVSGCSCGKKSDEEILKERIDTTKVHLYLATKIAILKADQSEEARVARDNLLKALKALRGQPTEGADGEPVRAMTAGDVVELLTALYGLRAEGKELLASGDEKGMAPFLPLLFEAPPELAAVLDLNMEHALLLTGMFVLKFHNQSPAPVPVELLLYEAWMTDSSKLLPGLSTFVHMQKAVVYGQNELCDLAAAEALGVDKERIERAQMVALLKASGAAGNIDEEQVKQVDASVRALTHGVTAYCYQQREEHDKAVAELDATLQALEDSGVAAGEIALLRAYVSMEQKDPAAARKHLEIARDYAGTDPDTKKDIEAILAELKDDPNIFQAKLGKAFFTIYLTKIILRNLDEAGVFDELKETELVKTVAGFVAAMTETMNKAKGSGTEVMDDLKGLVSDD